MNCPACKHPLIVLEYQDIELDHCIACKGIWLDAGELELLFGSTAPAADFLCGGVPRIAGEAVRRCPICRGRMRKETTSGADTVTYDICPRLHGMWFDSGELTAILQSGSSSPGGQQVVQWLREMFGAPTT